MATYRLGCFPNLNSKYLFDEIDKKILKQIIDLFPVNLFKNIYMENQLGSSGNYIINETGEMKKIESGKRLITPYFRLNIRQTANNMNDVFGSDIFSVHQQPGGFEIEPNLTGYRPIFYDQYGSIVALNERTIHQTFDMNASFQTKADQLAYCNVLDMMLKMNYVYVFNFETTIPIHNQMVEYLKSSVFKPELDALNKMLADSKEKKEQLIKINDMFTKYLYDFSERHIKPYRERYQNSEELKDYTYCYKQMQRVTVHFDKYEADEGSKRNNSWDNFNVSNSGWMEFGNIVNYITSVPAIVRGVKNNWYFKMSLSETNKNNYFKTLKFKEIYKETRRLKLVSKQYQSFYFERELLMASKTETFNILDDIIDLHDSSTHYVIMKALLDTIETVEEFNELFLVVIYKKDEAISDSSFTIDEKFNITVRDCDLTVPYYIDVFVHKQVYRNKLEEMMRKLQQIGVNTSKLDWNETNYHTKLGTYYTIKRFIGGEAVLLEPRYDELENFIGFFNTATDKIISAEGGLNAAALKYNELYKVYAHSMTMDKTRSGEIINYPRKGFGAIPSVTRYYLPDKSYKDFIVIPPPEFSVADPKYEYYVRIFEGEEERYYIVPTDYVERNPDKLFFIKVNDEFVECDWKQIMIPEPKLTFYTLDRERSIFVEHKNLEAFDKLQTYYIDLDDYLYRRSVYINIDGEEEKFNLSV